MGTAISNVTTPNTNAVSTVTPTGSNQLGEDSFLKLLTAQLQNQDPLQPADNSQFVAQLAQFSSLQEVQGTNSRLDSLLMSSSSTNQTATAGFIGKDVTFNSNQVAIGASGGSTVMGTLASNATKLTATITNSSGKVVRTINMNDVSAGALAVPWDGKSDSGEALPAGNYTVAFDAKDSVGNSVSISSQGKARVTGVSYAAGYPQLIVNGVKIKMSDVVEVDQAATTSTTTSTSTTP